MSAKYALGHTPEELQRLERQGRFYGDLTQEIFERAGIEPGMRVLDVGCGAGDVSLLVRSLVGAEGSVLGIDRSPQAVEIARSRAAAAELTNMDFEHGDLVDYQPQGQFDALVGRLVLPYVADPNSALRRLSGYLRSGGVIAFAELIPSTSRSVPELPLLAQCVSWIRQTFRSTGSELDVHSLHQIYVGAGLPAPEMLLLGRVEASPTSPTFEILAQAIRSVTPTMVELGIAKESEVDADTLADRLRQEATQARAVIVPPCLIGAWVRV